jgi:hypothetical protein
LGQAAFSIFDVLNYKKVYRFFGKKIQQMLTMAEDAEVA